MNEEKGLPKRVRLWNRGATNFDYEVLGQRYVIAPGGSIDVARRTAVAIKGFYPGKDVKVSLESEMIAGDYETTAAPIANDKERVMVYSCMKCDAEFSSKELLVAHNKEKHSPGRKAIVKEA